MKPPPNRPPAPRAVHRTLGVAFAVGLVLAAGCKDSDETQRSKRRRGRTAAKPRRVFSGRVAKVSDGDTIRVRVAGRRREVRVRLQGIDTPERRQPFGREATELARSLVQDKIVEVRSKKRDRYGRTIGQVFVDGRSLGEAMLAAGLAWHYRRYYKSQRYAELERQARAAKRGLWAQQMPIAPWDYRRARRELRRRRRGRRGRRRRAR